VTQSEAVSGQLVGCLPITPPPVILEVMS